MIYLQGKPKYSEKTCPVPLCPPQIPHGLARARTRASAVCMPNTPESMNDVESSVPIVNQLLSQAFRKTWTALPLHFFQGHGLPSPQTNITFQIPRSNG
jgi:hypothetical protein